MINYFKIDSGFQEIPQWEPGCCVNVINPSASEIDYLVQTFNVPTGFISDISDIDERPRTEVDDDWQLVIIRIPHQTDDKPLSFNTVPLGMLINGNVFIILCFHDTPLPLDFMEHKRLKKIKIRDFYELFLRLHITSAVWYLKYLKRLDRKITIAESALEKSVKNTELQNLMYIEKTLVFFSTSLKANSILLNRVKTSRLGKKNLDEETLELMEDAEIETQQAIALVDIYSNIMSGMMDAFASVISNNLNVMMKRLTSISIILMLPTLVASIYGMNIVNGMEKSPFAFVGVIAGSIFVSFLSVLLFRKNGWL